jgi:hypothetical protein
MTSIPFGYLPNLTRLKHASNPRCFGSSMTRNRPAPNPPSQRRQRVCEKRAVNGFMIDAEFPEAGLGTESLDT